MASVIGMVRFCVWRMLYAFISYEPSTRGANQAFSYMSFDSRVQIWPFCPVGFHGGCPELRHGPAQLRVLRNSPWAMPLSGILIIVMFALYTLRKQGKLQRACACGGHGIHVVLNGILHISVDLLNANQHKYINFA